MELSGSWHAAPADEELRRRFHDPAFDPKAWEMVPVPGHWQDVPAFADHDGGLLCRRDFALGDPAAERGDGARSWLELDGIFYQGDVYLDGEYLGDTEGYFVRHAFDITEALAGGDEHTVAAEINCRPSGAQRHRTLMGVFDGANDVVHQGNPGGIWAPVRIRTTGAVRLDRVRAICTAASARVAEVTIRARLDSAGARTVQLRTTLAGIDHQLDRPLADGANEIEWKVSVASPALWWPHVLGAQPLHDLVVRVDTDGAPSDERRMAIGLRSISMRKWRMEINGERLFLKGVNLAPTRFHLAQAGDDRILHDLQLAREAGFGLVRPYAHVAPPSFYRHADRLGLLVWQDLPLLGPAANSLRSEAVRQARAMVDQLGHHASIAMWNAHVSPATEQMVAEERSIKGSLSRLATHQLPTWTKSVLDRSVRRVFDGADGSRPSAAFTGVLPHLPRLDASATHLWFGWRRGTERDLADYAARIPSQVQFVAEFGAQSLPNSGPVVDAVAWPNPDGDVLQERFGYEKRSFDRYVPPVGHGSPDGWIAATQHYQAGLLRRQIETLRRLAYHPTGGFCVHFLADAQPRVSASLLDVDRTPKLAYQAVADACRPVIVVADRLPARLNGGDAAAVDIHVVSDLREELAGAIVEAALSWPGGGYSWRFTGAIAANGVTRVGTLSWVVPDAPGLATLRLTLSGPAEAHNRYDATIQRLPRR